MKTIGLIGGMSWESTASYYRMLNEGTKQALGGLHSAKIFLCSVDFAEIEAMQRAERWDDAARLLIGAANSVERAGADFLILCTNTMHQVAEQIQAAVAIPLLHIADATAEVLAADNRKRVGLLGTRFTMEQAFYRGRLEEKHDIEVVTPDGPDRELIHRIIYEELCLGQIRKQSRDGYLRVIDSLANKGVEAVILGCTEISLLVNQDHTIMPLYDTTAIHANKAVALALE